MFTMQNVTPFPNPSYFERSFSSISWSSAWDDQKSLHLKAPTIALVGALQVATSVGKRGTTSANTLGLNVASCFTRVAACGRGLRMRKKCWPDWIDRSRVLSAVQCRRCRVKGRLRNLAERYMAPSPRKLAIASAKCPQPSLMNVLELYRARCAGTRVRWDALRTKSRCFLLGGTGRFDRIA